MATDRIFPHFFTNYPFAHVFTVLCYIIPSCIILSACWDFIIHPYEHKTEAAVGTVPPLQSFFSLRINMSLAVQLWLTPRTPHPAEQLPLFDESGPVCFPAPPGVWCMTALPLKMQRYSTQREAGRADSTPPPCSTPSFSQSTSKTCGKERQTEKWRAVAMRY